MGLVTNARETRVTHVLHLTTTPPACCHLTIAHATTRHTQLGHSFIVTRVVHVLRPTTTNMLSPQHHPHR
jgi:hypothetical protein